MARSAEGLVWLLLFLLEFVLVLTLAFLLAQVWGLCLLPSGPQHVRTC